MGLNGNIPNPIATKTISTLVNLRNYKGRQYGRGLIDFRDIRVGPKISII
jgi:hypothetical protein